MPVLVHRVCSRLPPVMNASIWTTAVVCLLLGAAGGIAAYQAWSKRRLKVWPHEWTLTPRPVFTTHDRMLWEHLHAVLPQHVVLAKIPLLRFCHATSARQARYWYDLLNPLYVGFVICTPGGRVLVALDPDSDMRSSRPMLLKAAVLQACRIRHVRCRPGVLPSVAEIQGWVSAEGGASRQMATAEAERIEQAVAQLASTVRKRRAERAQWQDSAFADSFLVPDSRPNGAGLDEPEPDLGR